MGKYQKNTTRRIYFFSLLFLISVISFSSASFDFISEDIKRNYYPGESLKGSLQMSFEAEDIYSNLTTNFGSKATLLNLIQENDFTNGYEYNCSTQNCLNSYSVLNEISSFQLNPFDPGISSKKVIGFKLTGKDIEVADFNLKISGGAGKSCFNQLYLFPLLQEDYLMQNQLNIEESCSNKVYGCFQKDLLSSDYQETIIDKTPYCEKIHFPAAPGYKVGAKVINSTSGSADLKMQLFDSDYSPVGSCILPKVSQQEQELSCNIIYSAKEEEDYFVCINLDIPGSRGNINYKILSENTEDICGFTGIETSDFTSDFDIFAESLKYNIPAIELNSTTFNDAYNIDIKTFIQDFLEENYDNNCDKGCFIPFSVYSPVTQNINIDNFHFQYSSADGRVLELSKLYELSEIYPKVTSGILNLSIDNLNFNTSEKNSTKLMFYLRDNSLFDNSILLSIYENFNFDIYPNDFTFGEASTIYIISSSNITSSSWEINGITTESSNPYLITRFLNFGKNNLKVSIKNSKGEISQKTFEINVAITPESIENFHDYLELKMSNLSKDISSTADWISPLIIDLLDINEKKKTLSDFSLNNNSNSSLENIANSLKNINIPESLIVSSPAKIPLVLGYSSLNFNYIKALSEKEGYDEDSIKSAITQWVNENYDSTVEEYSYYTPEDDSALLKHFKIFLNEKNEVDKPVYLIIDYPLDSITFKKNYGQKSIDADFNSATYISLEGSTDVEFAIPTDMEYSDLKIYLSPDLNSIVQNVADYPESPPNNIWKKATWLWIILIFGAFLVYIALQEWYKRYYELHLFSNKDDIYNVINFIFNARNSGLKDNEIKKKLTERSWKGEQVNYAIRKLDGKRTGMWEIPLFKFLENRKVKSEIEKRQKINKERQTFIKRPNL